MLLAFLFYIFSTLCVSCSRGDIAGPRNSGEFAFFFLNVDEDDVVKFYRRDILSGKLEEIWTFGKYPAYKKFNDHMNMRTGTGCAFRGTEGNFMAYVHDDVNDRNSGQILVYDFTSQSGRVLGKFNISCELLWGSNIYATTQSCVSTIGNKNKELVIYFIDENDVEERARVPFYAQADDHSNVMFYDRTEAQYWGMVYDSDAELKWLDIDMGGSMPPDYWTYTLRNQKRIYSLQTQDQNTMIGAIEYEDDENGASKKAFVRLIYDDTKQWEFYWEEIVDMSEVDSLDANFFEPCWFVNGTTPSIQLTYVKALKDGKYVLYELNYTDRTKKEIDLSEFIDDLTYISAAKCI